MKNILVTGGTGLVGAHLLYYLTKSGINPIALKRSTSNTQKVKKIFNYYLNQGDKLYNQIDWRECDILDVIKLEAIVKNVSIVYHCAALISFNKMMKDKMIEINSTGTSNIIDLCLKYNINRFCYVSSIATLGSNQNGAIDETCWWDWKNQSSYAISKYLGEVEVWRGFAEGLSGFIVNPSLIIGPGVWDSGFGTIIKKSKLGSPFYPPGSCGLIDVNDLVQIMIKIMSSKINNERFIINSEHYNYQKLMGIIAQQFNKRPPTIKLKKWVLKLLITVDIMWNKFKGNKIELSADSVKYTTNNILLNTTKINNAIKFDYQDIEQNLINYTKIFIKEKTI